MLSEKKRKIIRLLHQKKYRQQEKLFLAEGGKCVEDLLLNGAEPELIVHDGSYTGSVTAGNALCTESSAGELAKLSLQSTPSGVLAVFRQKQYLPDAPFFHRGLRLFLDGLQDPGNLGTIIRSAHWFGVSGILLSSDSVEWYNPKTVQSTMGSLLSVPYTYIDRENLPGFKNRGAIYTADMKGISLYEVPRQQDALIVIGNESRGVSEQIKKMGDYSVHIPATHPSDRPESLNAALSTGLFLYEWNRRM